MELKAFIKMPPKIEAQFGNPNKTAVTSVNGKIGDVVLTASDIEFLDGETFQEKYNSGELRGQKGDKGDTGNSPKASILQDADGATITVIDDDGTTTAKLTNGTDGVSPTASVKQGVGEATITVTDGRGTTTATLKDGKTYDDTQVKANTKAINEGVPYNTLTGKSVTANDVSSYEHPVECKVSGKNLLDYTKGTTFDGSGTIELIPNGIKWTNKYFISIPFPQAEINKQYILNLDGEPNIIENSLWRYHYTDGTNDEMVHLKVPVLARKEIDSVYIYKPEPTIVGTTIFKNIQLEEGSTATPYEPYVDVEKVKVQRTNGDGTINNTYTPNPDGTVDGMTSVSPTMIVSTDNPNANLSVKYQLEPTNQIQTNEARVITAEMKIAELEKKLQTALLSMGGNV